MEAVAFADIAVMTIKPHWLLRVHPYLRRDLVSVHNVRFFWHLCVIRFTTFTKILK